MKDYMYNNFKRCGNTAAEMRVSFKEIENATKELDTDLSLFEVLSPQVVSGHYLKTIHPLENFNITADGLQGVETVNIDITGCVDCFNSPLLIDGGYCGRNNIKDKYTYLTDDILFKRTLPTKINIPNCTGILRDTIVSQNLYEMMDETPVKFIYREDNGIKKIFSVFSQLWNNVATLDDFLNAMSAIEYEVKYWEITQYKRFVYVELSEVPCCKGYVPGFVFEYSDTGFVSPNIQFVYRHPNVSASNFFIVKQILLRKDVLMDDVICEGIAYFNQMAKIQNSGIPVRFDCYDEFKQFFRPISSGNKVYKSHAKNIFPYIQGHRYSRDSLIINFVNVINKVDMNNETNAIIRNIAGDFFNLLVS